MTGPVHPGERQRTGQDAQRHDRDQQLAQERGPSGIRLVSFVRPYTADFVGWLRDFGQSTANYDANGHYARIQPIFNAFSFTSDPAGDVLKAIPDSDRLTALDSNNLTRCPGGATQVATDGSNDWRDSDGNLDCDPSETPPGP